MIGMFVGLAGVCACLTMLFWSMRAVMEIGGSCASGNVPYEITRPCPQGVGWMMTVSILGGIVFLGMYIVCSVGGPSLWPLAWPALFLSLGWNFFAYGFDPPFGSGVAPGWIICGVLFALMGGVPLVFLIKGGWFQSLFTGREMSAKGRWVPKNAPPDGSTTSSVTGETPRAVLLAIQGVAIVVGTWAGWRLFDWGNG